MNCTRCETAYGSLFYLYLTLVQTNYIFSDKDNLRIKTNFEENLEVYYQDKLHVLLTLLPVYIYI